MGLTDVYQTVVSPETSLLSYGFESDVEESQGNQDLGVRITKLEQIDKFFEGDDVIIYGTIIAESLKEPLTIKVYCSLENFQDGAKIPAKEISGVGAQGNEITLYPNSRQVLQAECVFPQGATFQGDSNNIISAQRANMYITYQFTTLASHTTYFLDKQELLSFQMQGEDPFQIYQVDDPQLNFDRTIKSKATPGPINVGIGTYQSQPFTQGIGYAFAVSMSNNPSYGGTLKKLEDVRVHIPGNVILESDPEYGADLLEQCAFEFTGEINDNGFRIYEVKPGELDFINQDCKDLSIANAHFSEQQCINFLKGDVNLRCKFKATEVPETLKYSFIRTEADYIYETQKSKAINIYRVVSSGTQQGASEAHEEDLYV